MEEELKAMKAARAGEKLAERDADAELAARGVGRVRIVVWQPLTHVIFPFA